MTTATARGKWWALAGVALSVLAVGMDLTVLSVALPTLAGALKASEPDLQWFSSGYALVLAAAMLPAGLLGDRYGRKKVMLWSLALFAAGSLACAYSRTPAQFIAARALLGLAGAGLVVMAVSALAVLFSEQERPKAVGVWAAANMVAFPVGPILGGWLLSHYWWGWVFLMNVPVALLGFVAVAVLVPESASPVRPGIDIVGVVSSSGRLGRRDLWPHPGRPARVGVGWGARPPGPGLGVIVAFFSWERALGRRPGGQPLIDLSLFGSPAFTWGVIIFAILTLALIGLLFTLPQYFQGVWGRARRARGVRLAPGRGRYARRPGPGGARGQAGRRQAVGGRGFRGARRRSGPGGDHHDVVERRFRRSPARPSSGPGPGSPWPRSPRPPWPSCPRTGPGWGRGSSKRSRTRARLSAPPSWAAP